MPPPLDDEMPWRTDFGENALDGRDGVVASLEEVKDLAPALLDERVRQWFLSVLFRRCMCVRACVYARVYTRVCTFACARACARVRVGVEA